MRIGFILWAAAGLLLALGVIAGVSAVGPGVLHISLTHGAMPAVGSGLTYPASNQASGKDLSVPGSEISPSSLNALTSGGGTTAGLVFAPILLGAAAGGLFYGLFTRKTGRD